MTIDTPPLSDDDAFLRTDEEWSVAARAYVAAKADADRAGEVLDGAKDALIVLTTRRKEIGSVVTVQRITKVGTVNYKGIPELSAIDLERLRGPSRQEVRITLA